MLKSEEVAGVLRAQKRKVTPQRLAVYEMLCHTHEHPNAEAIYRALQPAFPAMSLATVYKTLDVFAELGLVRALNAGEDSFRYDADTRPHPHVRCTACGRVEDIESVDDSDFLREIAQKTDYTLTGRQLYFQGICPACRAAGA